MSTRPGRRPSPFPPPDRVQISDPGEIAAAVPQLLGFRPSESVVLVCLGGRSGNRIGLTVRADLPPPDLTAAAARVLADTVSRARPDAVVAVLVSEVRDAPGSEDADLPHRGLLGDLTDALSGYGIPVRDALLVRSGRWWSYDCPDPCCRPAAGSAVPDGVSALEAASVLSGTVVASSRKALERRIEPDPGRPRTVAACARLAGREPTVAQNCGPATTPDRDAVREALSRCAPGTGAGTRLSDDLVARVVLALQDPGLRDRALLAALGEDAAAAEVLWAECTRRAPEPLDAAPATLLAVSAWLRGDGAMADIALRRALDSDPGYRLAGLLLPALAACLPPAELRALIAASADRDAAF